MLKNSSNIQSRQRRFEIILVKNDLRPELPDRKKNARFQAFVYRPTARIIKETSSKIGFQTCYSPTFLAKSAINLILQENSEEYFFVFQLAYEPSFFGPDLLSFSTSISS